jgi:DNA-directed RNA polymerase subunit RPC12/RpoP
MKCIRCGMKNNLKDRTANQGRCQICNHRFVFEPTAMDSKVRFTDSFFIKVLSDISVNNTLHFTAKQLFYLLEKRLIKKKTAALRNAANAAIGFGIVIAYTGLNFIKSGIGWPLIILGIGIIILRIGIVIFGWLQSKKPPKSPRKLTITPAMAEDWLNRWNRVNSAPEKLLLPTLPQSTPITINPEITNYSFDRLVVCDSEAIARMLIANNFHFENNCAILTISGYPQNIFDITMQMLRRNPQLEVYALHDCSPTGIKLTHQLRTDPDWFADSNIALIDVGLLPRQIIAARRNILIQNTSESARSAEIIASELPNLLTDPEWEWLKAGNFVELESFTPQTLIQILNRSIASSREANIEDGSLILIGDSGGYIYTTDSFG